MESSASGSSKRPRTPGSGAQVPSCLVDGCIADLSKCRDYHRRHKVCELHSKTPIVTIQGQEQRFCQQCSRFHSLVEFDEGKRSCRKRLDGHNRRRRKPQPDSLSIHSGRFFPNHQGTKFIPFGSPRVFSTGTGTVTSAWAEVVKAKSDAMLQSHSSEIDFTNRSLFHGSSSHNYKGGKQFPFLEGTNSTLPGNTVCQPLINANSSSSSCNGGGSEKAFSDGLSRAINASRALSLLSSPPQAETQEISLSHMVQTDSIPPGQSLIPSLNYSGLGLEGGEPMGSSLVSDGSSNANLHGHDMFHIGPDVSSTSETHQTLSFSWE